MIGPLGGAQVLPGHLADVTAARYHPNGGYILSASRDTTLRLWSVADATCVRLLLGHTAAVLAVAVTPDGAYAASGSEDCSLRIWHLGSGRCMRTLSSHTQPVSHVAFNGSGKLLASGGGKEVCVWDSRRALAADGNHLLVSRPRSAASLTAAHRPALRPR